MQDEQIDEALWKIADEYAEPSKKGELHLILKLLKESITKHQISKIEQSLIDLKTRFERDNITHLNTDNNEKVNEIKAKYNL